MQKKGPVKNSATETHSLSKAKAFLGRLLEKSERGTTIYVVRNGKRFLLQPVPEIEPVPLRPANFFQFDAEDVELDRKFSSANVIPTPDLE